MHAASVASLIKTAHPCSEGTDDLGYVHQEYAFLRSGTSAQQHTDGKLRHSDYFVDLPERLWDTPISPASLPAKIESAYSWSPILFS